MSKFYDDGICRYILIEANQVPGKDSASADKDTPTEKMAEIPSDGAALTDDTAPSDQSNDGAATGDNAAVCKEDYYAVYKCPRQMTEIAIPETINGIPVKAISPNTFNCKSIITAIKLPRQLVSIGDYAFNSCTSLEKIVIPSKVEKIGIMAFSSCAELKSIVVPPSVISIGEQAFENSDALKIIYVQKDSFAHKWFTEKLPQATGKLEFYNSDGSNREFSSPVYDFNYALTKDGVYIEKYTGSDEAVRVPATFSGTRVVGIGSDFLRGCTTVKSVFFPATIDDIDTDALSWCPSLENIFVDASNTTYTAEDGVLFSADRTRLIRCPEGKRCGIYIIPQGIRQLTVGAFYGCKLISGITIPKTVERIGAHCFEACAGITSFILPPTVKAIGAEAFKNCTNLKNVTIPPMLSDLGDNAFEHCVSLNDVYVIPGTSSVSVIKNAQDISGKMKTAPPFYYTDCMPYIADGMNITEIDMSQLGDMLGGLMGQNGIKIDPSKLADIAGSLFKGMDASGLGNSGDNDDDSSKPDGNDNDDSNGDTDEEEALSEPEKNDGEIDDDIRDDGAISLSEYLSRDDSGYGSTDSDSDSDSDGDSDSEDEDNGEDDRTDDGQKKNSRGNFDLFEQMFRSVRESDRQSKAGSQKKQKKSKSKTAKPFKLDVMSDEKFSEYIGKYDELLERTALETPESNNAKTSECNSAEKPDSGSDDKVGNRELTELKSPENRQPPNKL